jgi:hypothetical protein
LQIIIAIVCGGFAGLSTLGIRDDRKLALVFFEALATISMDQSPEIIDRSSAFKIWKRN